MYFLYLFKHKAPELEFKKMKLCSHSAGVNVQLAYTVALVILNNLAC